VESGDAPAPHPSATGGEIMPWGSGILTGRPVDDDLVPMDRMPTDQVPTRAPKVVRVRRSVLLWLVCLLVMAALVIAGLVHYLPARTAKASASSHASPTTAASSGQPSPANSASDGGTSAGATGSASPGGGASPGATANAVVAGGGGLGAPLADLSALSPVSQTNVNNQSTGPEQIGATTYEDSVRFTCDSWSGASSGNLVYDVAGYKFLTALIGIPSNASNGAGNAMTITFYRDGSATQLAAPITVSLDHPQPVHLDLQGSSQLEISCSGTNTTGQQATQMDVALGNATIGPT
jgi:hypothetical protein